VCNKTSIYDGTFWDLWVQKIFRNFASMKYQVLLLLYGVTVYGMFWAPQDCRISAVLGMGFLGGGFITMATSRIIANTSLFEKGNGKKEDELQSRVRGQELDTEN